MLSLYQHLNTVTKTRPPHSPEDFLVGLAWVFVIGHYTWLEVFIPSSVP